MKIALLIIIYLIFISLGLPDSFIGSCWPTISEYFKISRDFQGIFSLIVSFFTIASSFLTIKLTKYLKNYGVIAISIGLTISGLIIIGFSDNYYLLLLAAIPLGFGGGAIDSILNSYVSLHYKAIHLNFLHAFWGIGAFISPLIIGSFIVDPRGFKDAAFVLSIIQTTILIITLSTLVLWVKVDKIYNIDSRNTTNSENNKENIGFFNTFKLRGVLFACITFFSYIAIESLAYSWFTSLCVFGMNIDNDIASKYLSLFYIAISLGRVISGLLSIKIKDKNLIRIGEGILLIGIILLTFKFNFVFMPIALFIIGLGCGPIYPSIVHSTVDKFTSKYSSAVMSIQIGFAYMANISVAPLFGILGNATTFLILPYIMLIFFIILVSGNEIVLKLTKDKSKLDKKLVIHN
ncbi:MAG: MFS transporter [Methanobrevibacter boviskoreani]|uniref:MFS transporter n=1 Tax=Methanobrevibacter boviskoreani TaxID=1348249 RepID=UPI0023A8100B|nr:MFS transporter [Methanobrevibacter boviskoreani]MCI6931416.1 MFS transporter [Methanobrevibacter boviskoreani]